MATTRGFTFDTGAARFKSIPATSADETDASTVTANTVSIAYTIKATIGVAAAGEKVNVYLKRTAGDPDGAAGDEFETDPGELIGTLNLETSTTAILSPAGYPRSKAEIFRFDNMASAAVTCSVVAEDDDRA